MVRIAGMLAVFIFMLSGSPTVLLAQSEAENLARADQLQEQVRRLNGKVEELTFQLLQLQEQIRKMQEDNEFRFQELEDKHSDAGGSGGNKTADIGSRAKGGVSRLGKSQPSEGVVSTLPSGGKSTSKPIIAAGKILGVPTNSLGTLKFDKDGNVIESAIGRPLDLTTPTKPLDNRYLGELGSDLANLQPGLLLARGRDFYDAGKYVLAEKILRKLIKDYPDEANRPEAQYWIGRSLFARGEFHAAATIFLDTHNTYPDALRAPDTLLRLGLSMAGLNQREIACATYDEVLKQFPDADEKIKTQVSVERTSARC